MLGSDTVRMGSLPPQWKGGVAKTITFCVTEDCNLACKYCYMTGKNSKNKMSFETAKKAVDYILSNREEFNEEAVIIEFIGGEPFLEIELIDRISDYIKYRMFILDHPWFGNYRFSISTNGILYGTPQVQEYIRKNHNNLSVGMSVDGNKMKHDLQRVMLDGSGSYDEVVGNVPLWQSQFPVSSTKATFAHDDLPYLKDSIISLWDIGIKTVAANVVFEDVWHEGDDILFENQLKDLADYVLDKGIWKDHTVRFFDPKIGFPLKADEMKKNFCGSGKMLAIDYRGNLYPCVRFLDYSLNRRKGYCIGSLDEGIKHDKIRPFLALTLESQSQPECINCEVAVGCAWCQGNNYELADTDTIYQRTTFNCKMHKANVRAVEYFWNQFSRITGLESEREKYKRQRYASQPEGGSVFKYLQFIVTDDATPHCTYRNDRKTSNIMSPEIFEKGMEFAERNSLTPMFIGNVERIMGNNYDRYLSIVDSKSSQRGENSIFVYDNHTIIPEDSTGNCILLINKANIPEIYQAVVGLHKDNARINLILEEIEHWGKEDIAAYEEQLERLVVYTADVIRQKKPIEINVLTDILYMKTMCNCESGNGTYALAPNGRFYLCPAFYFNDPEDHIGTLENGIEIKNKQLLEIKNAPLCFQCDANHCRRCKFMNKKLTGEINTPSKIQCTISHIERNKSRELQILLEADGLNAFPNILPEIDYLDPLEKIMKDKRSVVNA